MGYASEASLALTDWAKVHRPTHQQVGFALPGNTGSLRILERMGMSFSDYRKIAGTEFAFYRLVP
jgi:RimJ/RimL family protein N-acetyltransferase